jgi:hypothetical protein
VWLREALGHNRALYDADLTPYHRWELAATLRELGVVERNRGNHDEALVWLREALGHNRALYDEDPTPDHRRELAATLAPLQAVEAVHPGGSAPSS